MSRKSIRKLIFAILAVWVILMLVGLLFSRSFQGKIIEKLTEEANRNLLAEVHIRKSNIHFSIFKKFPLASIEVRNVVIILPPAIDRESTNARYGDTLLYADKLYLQLNLRSLLKNEFLLQKISVNNGFIQILTDKNGNSSLDIIKPGKTDKTFKSNIKSFSLSEVKVFTKSEVSDIQSTIQVKKGELSGVFNDSDFSVNLKSAGTIENLHSQLKEFHPMQKYRVDVAIERKNKTYSIKKGIFKVSNIPLQVVGTINTDGNTLLDLVFSAKEVSLKQVDQSFLDGLIGKSGFEPHGGILNIQSTVKGYVKHSSPIIKTNFTIQKAKLKHPKSKSVISDIYIHGSADNGNNQQDKKSFSVQIDSFNISTESSNQYGNLSLLYSNKPKLQATMKGSLSAKDINNFMSLPGLTILSGQIENNVQFRANLPTKDEKKSDINYNGALITKDIEIQFKNYNIPVINLNGQVILIDKHSLKFDSLLCKAANTELIVNTSLSNLQKKNAMPILSGKVHATTLYIDDFLKKSEKNSKERIALILPDSIIIQPTFLSVEKFYFGKFNAQNLKTKLNYHNKELKLSEFYMQSCSGSLQGDIEIVQNPKSDLEMRVNSRVTNAELEQLFYSLNNFGQKIISSDHVNGTLSGTIQFISNWDNKLKIKNESIITQGSILLENGELNNFDPLMGLSKFIEVEELKSVQFDNLKTSITIRNRKVLLDQTHIVSSAISFDGSGIHDFDNKYEYRLQVGLSDILWKKARKKRKDISEFGYVVDDGKGRTTIPVVISGKGSQFDVKYDKHTSRTKFKEKVSQEKAVLKNLFNHEETTKTIENPSADSEVKEDEEEKKPILEKTDSGTYRNKSDDFILDWDDSEEEVDDGGENNI